MCSTVQQDVQTLAAAVDALSCATQAEQPQQEASLVPGHSRDIGRRPVPTNDPNNLTEDGIKSSPLPSQVRSTVPRSVNHKFAIARKTPALLTLLLILVSERSYC